jgi:hypothetical protein
MSKRKSDETPAAGDRDKPAKGGKKGDGPPEGLLYCPTHDFALCPEHYGECLGTGGACKLVHNPAATFCAVCAGRLKPRATREEERRTRAQSDQADATDPAAAPAE